MNYRHEQDVYKQFIRPDVKSIATSNLRPRMLSGLLADHRDLQNNWLTKKCKPMISRITDEHCQFEQQKQRLQICSILIQNVLTNIAK
jgi:hypothetical protein